MGSIPVTVKINVKCVVPRSAMEALEGVKVWFHSFSTLAVDGDEWSA
jgi:hypothetical protein